MKSLKKLPLREYFTCILIGLYVVATSGVASAQRTAGCEDPTDPRAIAVSHVPRDVHEIVGPCWYFFFYEGPRLRRSDDEDLDTFFRRASREHATVFRYTPGSGPTLTEAIAARQPTIMDDLIAFMGILNFEPAQRSPTGRSGGLPGGLCPECSSDKTLQIMYIAATIASLTVAQTTRVLAKFGRRALPFLRRLGVLRAPDMVALENNVFSIRMTQADYEAALGMPFPEQYFDEIGRAVNAVGEEAARRVMQNPRFVKLYRSGGKSLTEAGRLFHEEAKLAGRQMSKQLPQGYRFRFEERVRGKTGYSIPDVLIETPNGLLLEFDWKTTGRSALRSVGQMAKHTHHVLEEFQRTLTRQESRSWVDYVRPLLANPKSKVTR